MDGDCGGGRRLSLDPRETGSVPARSSSVPLASTSVVVGASERVATVRGMDEKWWLDQQLVELRAIHVATLAGWDAVRPDQDGHEVELSADQVEAMRAALDAEEEYLARRRELGLP